MFITNSDVYTQNLNIKTYTYKDGLPTHSFFDAVQDTTGRMWFACSKGLTVYDGFEWKFLSVDEGVPMANYIKIELDDEGRIWALPKTPTNSIIFRDKNEWRKIPPILNSSVTLDMKMWGSSSNPKISVISRDSIFVFNGIKWDSYTNSFPESTLFFSIDFSNDQLYVSTSTGLYIMLKENFKINKVSLKFQADESILSIYTRPNANNTDIYILTNYAIYEYTNNEINLILENFNISTSLEYQHFFLAVDQFDNFYFGNDIITFHYNNRNKMFQLLGKSLNDKSFGASGVYLDRENNKWITTFRGIVKLSNSPFFSFYKSDGLLSNEVSSIEQFDDGRLIIGHNEGFSILTNYSFNKYMFDNYNEFFNQDSRVLDMVNFNSEIYFTAAKLGFGKWSNNNIIKWEIKNSNYQFLTLKNFKDELLVYKIDTLFKFKDNNLSVYSTFNHKSRIGAREITVVKNDIILIATNGIGLIKINNRYNNSVIKSYYNDYNNAYAIFEQNDSTILVGTKGGLCKIQDSILVPYSIKNLAINEPIYFIEAGNKPGSIWFGLDKGAIYCEDGKARRYDPNSGLAGYETNRHAGFLDSKGNFWIGTDNGLSMFAAGNEDIIPPKPLIDILYLEDREFNKFDLRNKIQLDYNHNSFAIHFRCLSFIDESNIKFFPKLLDSDGEVIEEFETKEKSARFSNLLPGSYRIELSAINSNSINSNVISSNIITVDSPFYYSIWFFILIIGGLVFIGFSVQKSISQKKYAKLLEKEVKERTSELEKVEELKSKAIYENIENDRKRISRDLHDGLGQILTSAKLKLETFQLSKSIDDKQFSGSLDLIKNTGQTLRKIVHNLHPLEIEKYGLAVSIEMMCNEMNNDSPIKIVSQIGNYSRRLSKKNEVMVFRIVQEALNNAIRHSNAKEINLIFWESIGNLHITIIDDGCGFDLADKLDAKIKGRHFGLVNINQRANFIGADLVISSKINLGTTIKLEVPFNE
ncbi:MAG: hypothetical protein HND52_13835 [Ignavibacteriae bacterium]|nr:hypothetical protein [Ignavibacteriota bacterium]